MKTGVMMLKSSVAMKGINNFLYIVIIIHNNTVFNVFLINKCTKYSVKKKIISKKNDIFFLSSQPQELFS